MSEPLTPEQLDAMLADRIAYFGLGEPAQMRGFELADDADRPSDHKPITDALKAADQLADHVQDLIAEVRRLSDLATTWQTATAAREDELAQARRDAAQATTTAARLGGELATARAEVERLCGELKASVQALLDVDDHVGAESAMAILNAFHRAHGWTEGGCAHCISIAGPQDGGEGR